MIYASIVDERGAVTFPEFTGERVYMEPFTQAAGLPVHLARWQNTVDQMLVGIEVDSPIYIMIDQTHVEAGRPQRRPGVHIDGYWLPEVRAHMGGGSHVARSIPNPRREGYHSAGGHTGGGGHASSNFQAMDWSLASFDAPEAIILATNVSSAQAYIGEYSGPIGDMGDCTGLTIEHMARRRMEANRAYAGNVCFLHESLPVEQDCDRTLVRLNVPGWSPR